MATGHWMPGNRSTRVPRRWVALAVAATGHRARNGATVERLDRATAIAVHHRTDWGRATHVRVHQVMDAARLWDWIGQQTRARERTIVTMHQAGRVMLVTDALRQLVDQGWVMRQQSLAGDHLWARLTRAGATLTLCDTESWVGCAPWEVAPVRPGHPHPPWRDRRYDQAQAGDDWTGAASTCDLTWRYLSWVARDDLGAWRVTGPGQGWAAWRHRWMPARTILCHTEPDALALEAEAVWTARTEAWRHGHVDGPLTEWDYTCSYPSVARDAHLPVRLSEVIQRPRRTDEVRALQRGRYVAACTVTTEAPTVPTRHAGAIIWPVGTFETTLWDCEIGLARQHGAAVEISRMATYDAAPVMRAWAKWCIAVATAPPGEADDVARRAVKGWGRSVIGRMGMRVHDWETRDDEPDWEVSITPSVNAQTGERGVVAQWGNHVWESTGRRYHPDAVPAIMGAIISEARCRLWRATLIAGQDHVVYMDTDSLIVDAEGDRRLAGRPTGTEHDGLRVKDRHAWLDIMAARRMITPTGPRVSGLPTGAVHQSGDTWMAPVTERFAQAQSGGQAGGAVTTIRQFTVRPGDPRRVTGPHGTTLPIRLPAQ